ncbi:MAG: amidohydrolase [Actinobacteria bacterium]|nr:amidohydrolase [Actinomycetota bacterium]
MIIDFHCHVGKGRRKSLEAIELIRKMDDCGVDKAVICPVEEGITVYNEEGNKYILDAVNEFPDRLIGFLSVNPWFGKSAQDMARKFLDQGLSGLKLHPNLQGFMINDEIIYPLMEIAKEYGIPVYTHCGTPLYSLPYQVWDLACEFKDVPIVMGHIGYIYGHDEEAIEVFKITNNLFLETSVAGLSDAPFSSFFRVISDFDNKRLLFGSDMPESDMNIEIEKIRSIGFSDNELKNILGENAKRLLTRR